MLTTQQHLWALTWRAMNTRPNAHKGLPLRAKAVYNGGPDGNGLP
jgi:hypothetical protein